MKYSIALRICGETLNPENITRDLMIEPDTQHKKGDVFTVRSKRGKKIGDVHYKNGMWGRNFEIEENDFRDSLKKIYDTLKLYKEKLKEYKDKGYQIDLFCGIWYETGDNKIEIDEELIDMFLNINILIDLDEYWL